MRLFTKSATVSASSFIDEQFHLVTLSGEALRGVHWVPGQKVQLALGGWVQRTYTPLSWDTVAGSTQLLLHSHGQGPGSSWARTLRVGDSCTVFGPRDSLDLESLQRPGLLFGDETSFGLAHALRSTTLGASGVALVFEVSALESAQRALDSLGLSGARLIQRARDDQHLTEVEQVIAACVAADDIRGCVLTGKASSIQRLNKQLRALGLTGRQIRTRAYWATGKAGLD